MENATWFILGPAHLPSAPVGFHGCVLNSSLLIPRCPRTGLAFPSLSLSLDLCYPPPMICSCKQGEERREPVIRYWLLLLAGIWVQGREGEELDLHSITCQRGGGRPLQPRLAVPWYVWWATSNLLPTSDPDVNSRSWHKCCNFLGLPFHWDGGGGLLKGAVDFIALKWGTMTQCNGWWEGKPGSWQVTCMYVHEVRYCESLHLPCDYPHD